MAKQITTFLMFEGTAEAAMTFYTSLFQDAEIVELNRYGPNEEGTEGSVRDAVFTLPGQRLMCIDSPIAHQFTFTPATSLFVECDSEEEIDRLYAALSEGGAVLMPIGSYGFGTRFGWVNDRFGVSWQVNLA